MKKYENEFHQNYLQGKQSRQYEDSGKIFLFCVIGLGVILIIGILSNI